MKNYMLSFLLACTLVAVSVCFHVIEPLKSIRENIFLILIALFAITMPAIGSLCTKILELKKMYNGITLLPMKEINKALYEQTIPIFATPFLIMLYDYTQRSNKNHLYLSAIDILLSIFLFHSVFVIFDTFKSFLVIAEAVSDILDNKRTDI